MASSIPIIWIWIIFKQIYYSWDSNILPLQVRVDLEVMAMKEYSIHPRSLKLEPQYLMQLSIIPFEGVVGVRGLTPLQGIQSVIDRTGFYTRIIGGGEKKRKEESYTVRAYFPDSLSLSSFIYYPSLQAYLPN